jgi:quinol-cytochrome oxidoreductase complex cytochrome b subunit
MTLARALDERLHLYPATKRALDKAFPDHWSFMLGELALYCLIALTITGTYLTLFFEPSGATTTYDGSYVPLHHVEMSTAFRSTLELSFDVRAGLLARQAHHWAALIFVAAIVAHLCRIFFTGAFRKPREANWLIGTTMLLLAILNGFTGYSMVDDLLSGTGLRIMFSVIQSVPVVGERLAFLVFDGDFPGTSVIHRLFISHVLFVPVALFGLVGLHVAMIWRQKHTQFPGAAQARRLDRRLAPLACLCSESNRHDARRAGHVHVPRRPGAHQSDLAVRTVRHHEHQHSRAARLVHGMAGGRHPALPSVGGPRCRPCRAEPLLPGGPAPRCDVRRPLRLAIRRATADRRP